MYGLSGPELRRLMRLNRDFINSAAINAAASATILGAAIISGGGNHSASGFNPGNRFGNASGSGQHSASGYKSSGGTAVVSSSGRHVAGVGTKASGNWTYVVTAGRGAINTFAINSSAINAGVAGAVVQIPTPVRISGGGKQTALGQKPSGGFAKISEGGYLLSAGQKNAFGTARISGSGGHSAVGKVRGDVGRIAGEGAHRASGTKNLTFGIVSGSGKHTASGFRQSSGFATQRGEGRHISRARRGETIPIDFNLHVGPLITFRIHVSPAGVRSMEDYLAPGSTNTVRVTKMVNALTRQSVADATVTGTLLDKNGTPVTDAINFPITKVGAEWDGNIASTVNIVAPDPYTVRVKAVTADGVREKDLPIPARRV